MKKKPTAKDVVRRILKNRNGINLLIAIKAMYAEDNEPTRFYRNVKLALRYRTVEDLFYHYRWELSMTKDHAQYQNH